MKYIRAQRSCFRLPSQTPLPHFPSADNIKRKIWKFLLKEPVVLLQNQRDLSMLVSSPD